ncbi:MAG TPA: hypothetical protein VIG71_11035 [Enteractinococcus sp.]
MSHAQPAEPRAPKTLGQRIVQVCFIVLFLGVLVMIPIGCVSMGSGSPTDLRWGVCNVTQATAEQTNDDELPWRIVIESTDCPTLIYTDGLTDDNAEGLAGTFEQAPYEVRVHESAIDVEGSIRYAKELKIHSYRPAPQEGM